MRHCDFRPISRCVSDTIQGPVLQNADSNSYAIYRMVPFPKIYFTVSSHQKFHEAQFINKHRLK